MTIAASAASISTCRASIIAMAANAITCAVSACSSGAAARKAAPRYAKALPGFGVDFKKAVKQRYPALVALHPYGETLGRAGKSHHSG